MRCTTSDISRRGGIACDIGRGICLWCLTCLIRWGAISLSSIRVRVSNICLNRCVCNDSWITLLCRRIACCRVSCISGCCTCCVWSRIHTGTGVGLVGTGARVGSITRSYIQGCVRRLNSWVAHWGVGTRITGYILCRSGSISECGVRCWITGNILTRLSCSVWCCICSLVRRDLLCPICRVGCCIRARAVLSGWCRVCKLIARRIRRRVNTSAWICLVYGLDRSCLVRCSDVRWILYRVIYRRACIGRILRSCICWDGLSCSVWCCICSLVRRDLLCTICHVCCCCIRARAVLNGWCCVCSLIARRIRRRVCTSAWIRLVCGLDRNCLIRLSDVRLIWYRAIRHRACIGRICRCYICWDGLSLIRRCTVINPSGICRYLGRSSVPSSFIW